MSRGCYTRWNAKQTTESFSRIDIVDLKKWGILGKSKAGQFSWSRNGKELSCVGYSTTNECMNLRYVNICRSSGQRVEINERFEFIKTDCNFGGVRFWFKCPDCSNKVRVLYGGKYFRCRQCHNLVNASTNESRNDRSARQIDKLQSILSPQIELSTFDGASFLPKPKWMKQVRYEALIEKSRKQEQIFRITAIKRFGLEVSPFFLE